MFDTSDTKVWEPPPLDLLEDSLPEQSPHRPLSPVPDVQEHLTQLEKNAAAKMTDQIGVALRAGLGIGALALMPDLIEDLRRAKDPDTRIKFMQLAFKEGGYGVKEDKLSNLPVFHFNFVNGLGVEVVREESRQPQIEDATYTKAAPVAQSDEMAPEMYWGVRADDINGDVQANVPVAELSVFDLMVGV